MSLLMSFESPLEFLLRYTVIAGIIVAIVGTAICMLAKRITMAKRDQDYVDKSDKLYSTLQMLGLAFILIGMIMIALPIDATFYVGG